MLVFGPSCLPVTAAWEPTYAWQKGQPFQTAFWMFERGYVRNNELQYYVPDFGQNVRLDDDGLLVFEARKERVTNRQFVKGSTDWRTAKAFGKYTSGSIRTKQTWQNGQFEIVARVHGGKGLWPAIWLVGENKGQYGEIDIMEYIGDNHGRVFTTYHWGSSARDSQQRQIITPIAKLENAFVTYRAELTPTQVRLFINGRQVMRVSRQGKKWRGLAPLVQPFRLSLNLALGGWAGKLNDHALPAKMEIRSIRIWNWRP